MNESLSEVVELRRQIRAVRAEMRKHGIRRTSCFNGGLDNLTYSFNSEMFRLETRLSVALKAAR